MARTKGFDEKEVLEKILALFNQKGFYQCSLDDIIKASGISRQSIYDTYGDKKTLFIKALELSKEQFVLGIDLQMDQSFGQQRPSQECLQDVLFNCDCHATGQGCFLLNSMMEFKEEEQDIRIVIDSAVAYFEGSLQKIVRYGQSRGELIDTMPAEQVVAILMNARNGLLAEMGYGKPHEELREIADWTIFLITKKD